MASAQPPSEWQPKVPPLSTSWTHLVGPHNAHPEYPRPQLTRPKWVNLNGLWQYAAGVQGRGVPSHLAEQILVPYPPESALSGIARHDDLMWYGRTFNVPQDWRGRRVLLHFGAVDQQATVWVNGIQVATHTGGYASFSADITGALHSSGPQQLVVHAVDRDEAAEYPVGKQRARPGGILYTGSSGIWQTVWMEPVPTVHIEQVNITSEVANGSIAVTPHVTGATNQQVKVTARAQHGGPVVAEAIGASNAPIRVVIPRAHLWSPSDPYLYDLNIRVLDARGQTVDEVGSYAGIRSIALQKDAAGRLRMALNGKIYFQYGPLDQGFWPDGIYTAPTDDALRFDLEQAKALGFNMVRKHMKVEPDRWYYWADHLGLLVWQDMPALPINLSDPPGTQPPPNGTQKANYMAGLDELIDQHRSFPSIVVWTPFNEGWGEFDTARVAARVKAKDPARLVDPSSGVNCCYSLPDSHAGDIYDDHTYVGPGMPMVNGDRASVDGEYGGLGLVLTGHVWPGQLQAYEMESSRVQLTQRYSALSEKLVQTVAANGVSAAVYTQITDVEEEINGLLTYDRKVIKPDAAQVRADNLRVIETGSR